MRAFLHTASDTGTADAVVLIALGGLVMAVVVGLLLWRRRAHGRA